MSCLNKILEPFPMPIPIPPTHLVVSNDCLAVAGGDESRPDIFKVKLWKEELFRREIELPGVKALNVDDVVLESPFLVVGGDGWIGGRLFSWIKVFNIKLAARS